eukprot:4161394-Ditylum_brightwellii.AAC.1
MEYMMFGWYNYRIWKVQRGKGRKRALMSEDCLTTVPCVFSLPHVYALVLWWVLTLPCRNSTSQHDISNE